MDKRTINVLMRYGLLAMLLTALTGSGQAQSGAFTVGPVIGIDQFLSGPQRATDPGVMGDVFVHYKSGFMYGLEGTYALKRLLIDARLLHTKRVYEVTGPYPYYPALQVRVRVEAPYYSLPITVSYQVKTIQQIQLFAGVGVVAEWVGGAFDRYSFDIYGSGRVHQLEPEPAAKAFSIGGSLQVIGRYALSPHYWLQLQPAMHYFSKVPTPFATTNNSAFSVSVSVNYQLK